MIHRRWLRIIPVAFVMYTIAFIDRTNVSLALPSMTRDLHMNPTQAGLAAGIFFWGYLVLQVPGGYLAHRWSAKKFISILLVAWGLCSVATGFVHTGHQFLAMRLILGVAEGGVWPATLVLLANWFPRGERARANAYWMLCLPVAVVLSSPLSGWILGRWNWRVLLISEGLFPIIWLALWLWQVNDYPRQARWISREERQYLETTLNAEAVALEAAESASRRSALSFLRALFHPKVLVLVLVYFLNTTGNYGLLFWLPTAIEHAARVTSFHTGLLFAFPYLIAILGMVIFSNHSDGHLERRGHVAVALGWGGLFMLAGVLASSKPGVLSYLLVALVGAGSYGFLGPFWAIPSETLPKDVAGAAMGLINSVGNLGGFFGPLLVGYLNQRTGSFKLAFGLLAAGWLIDALICVTLVSARKPVARADQVAAG
ncbi:MAG: MFS transporter [Terriglobia bacterium]